MSFILRRPMRALALLLLGLGLGSMLLSGCGSDHPTGAVHVSRMAQEIGPVSANFIDRALDRAEKQDAVAWILMMDTPGGLISSTDDIVQRILAAQIPVVIFVSPAGARAASAGTFITMAAHIAAMAPNTQIGAAHPISGSGSDIDGDLRDKVTNDAAADIRGIAKHRGRNEEWAESAVRESVSITGDEAVELNVVDLTAYSLLDLIDQIDGREVLLDPDGETVTLDLANAPIVETNYNVVESILDVIADPNIAFIFTSIGSLLLLVEAFSPGLVGPGVFGVILLIFGFFALGPLDTNPAGIALLVLALVLLIAEVFVAGFGFLGIGGIVALILGGLLLIGDASVDAEKVSFALGPLDTNPAGIALLVLALVLLIAEVFVAGFGFLGIGGIVALILGGLLLIGDASVDAEKVSIWALVVSAGLIGALVFGVGTLVAVDRRRPKWSFQGPRGIVGREGVAHNTLTPGGTVFVGAELWSARSAEGVEISEGSSVKVVGMEGLTAIVESTEPPKSSDE